MILNGKTLVFTDIHWGIKSNATSRLNICAKVTKEIVLAIKNNNIDNIIFCGDFFHDRNQLNINTITVALKCLLAISKVAKNVVMIVGNHDSYLKNSLDINSITIFKTTQNISIVDKVEELILNGEKALLVPWLGDISTYANDYKMLFGHFDISSKYLMTTYVEDHSNGKIGTSAAINRLINDDELLSECQNTKNDELIGDFIEHLVTGGICYSGHIHTHREAIVKKRQLVFVGSPYLTTFGEKDYVLGFYILDESNVRKFIETTTAPKHVELVVSDIINTGIDIYDFSNVSGNIVRKVYDVEVDNKFEADLALKIIDRKPFEEALPEYRVSISNMISNGIEDTAKVLNKSKLDYIRTYIDNIDSTILSDNKIDKEKLYTYLEQYYIKATEE